MIMSSIPSHAASPALAVKHTGKTMLVHYMPWFQSKAFSGAWGWHWTMAHFKPDKVVANRREIASKHYPLLGPYDSSDPDALEAQVAWMKLAGVDGAILDWYGSHNYNDYGSINKASRLFAAWAARAGLKVAICYEADSLRRVIEGGAFGTDASELGKQDLEELKSKWFNTPAYLRLQGRPVLLVFGIKQLQGGQWNEVLSGATTAPLLLCGDIPETPAEGAYAWPPMHLAGGGNLDLEKLLNFLDTFYHQSTGWKGSAGLVCPGFNDIYGPAGVRSSYGSIDPRGTVTFQRTLDRALRSTCPFAQIVTWNDYGEGTEIEPTVENGFAYLELLQKARQEADPSFAFTAVDLRLPQRLYLLRKRFKGNAAAMAVLDQAAACIFAGQTGQAGKLLAYLETGKK
jgi:hypothetical protein